MKLRLIMDVEYEPDGVSEQELREMLDSVPRRATSEGMLTQDTPATVESWTSRIERIEED